MMQLIRQFKACGGVLAIAAALISASTNRALSESVGVKNIVLVHGAFADATSWSKVIPILEADGYHVVAVQNPLTSLADDVAATKRILALQDGPVILVGHSWGGAVITQVGDEVSRLHATGTTLPTCHLAMLQEPGKVAAVIRDAARNAGGK
jgi:alpha-beta hydrolase superfamily lysophospholipase